MLDSFVLSSFNLYSEKVLNIVPLSFCLVNGDVRQVHSSLNKF